MPLGMGAYSVTKLAWPEVEPASLQQTAWGGALRTGRYVLVSATGDGSMSDIRVPDDLWATNMMPEGVLERWLVADGDSVRAGAPLAMVRIEGALHEIISPAGGLLG